MILLRLNINCRNNSDLQKKVELILFAGFIVLTNERPSFVNKRCQEKPSVLHMLYLKIQEKPAKEWTMFNTHKQTCMQTLEFFSNWQCSILAKNHSALFPIFPKPFCC